MFCENSLRVCGGYFFSYLCLKQFNMKATTEINADPITDESQFPCIGAGLDSEGLVVMFSDFGEGVVISPDNNQYFPLGEYRETWNMGSFTEFKGKVILQND